MNNEDKFWYRWMLSYSTGELLGIGAAVVVARLLFVEYAHLYPKASAALNGFILVVTGATEGLIIGYAQWKSLSKLVMGLSRRRWMIVSAVAFIAGWLLILPPAVLIIFLFARITAVSQYSSVMYTLAAGLAFGGIVGIAQYFVIRKFFYNSLAWIFANAAGWAVSFLILYLILPYLANDILNAVLILLACVLSGGVQGIITGSSVHLLMRIRPGKALNSTSLFS